MFHHPPINIGSLPSWTFPPRSPPSWIFPPRSLPSWTFPLRSLPSWTFSHYVSLLSFLFPPNPNFISTIGGASDPSSLEWQSNVNPLGVVCARTCSTVVAAECRAMQPMRCLDSRRRMRLLWISTRPTFKVFLRHHSRYICIMSFTYPLPHLVYPIVRQSFPSSTFTV